jgi:sec-independent protein translocase protein TatA
MGLSWQHLLILLLIVLLVFGTKRLSSFGSDMGKAIRGFKKAMSEEGEPEKLEADAKSDASAKDASKQRSE